MVITSKLNFFLNTLNNQQVEPEEFCDRLERLLNASPQPCLIGFLKKSLPLLRQALITKELVIDGIRPPPMTVVYQLPQGGLVMPTTLQVCSSSGLFYVWCHCTFGTCETFLRVPVACDLSCGICLPSPLINKYVVDRIGFDVSGGPQARSPAQGQIRLQAPQMTTQVRVMTPMGAGVRAPTLQHRIVTVSAPITAASNTTTVRLTTVSPHQLL